jgi:tRNA pseudouridine55 synthase
VGSFDLKVARALEDLAEDFAVLPIADAARASFVPVDLDEGQAADVRFGRALDLSLPGGGPHALFAPDGAFLALYEQRGQQAKAVAVFV